MKFIHIKKINLSIFLLLVLFPLKSFSAGQDYLFDYGNSHFEVVTDIVEFDQGQYYFAARAYDQNLFDNKNAYFAIFKLNTTDGSLHKVFRIRDKNLEYTDPELIKFKENLYLFGTSQAGTRRDFNIHVLSSTGEIDRFNIPADKNNKIQIINSVIYKDQLWLYTSRFDAHNNIKENLIYLTDGDDWSEKNLVTDDSPFQLGKFKKFGQKIIAEYQQRYYISENGIAFTKPTEKFPYADISARLVDHHIFNGHHFAIRNKRLREYSNGRWTTGVIRKQISLHHAASKNFVLYKTAEYLHRGEVANPKHNDWVMTDDGENFYLLTLLDDNNYHVNSIYGAEGGVVIGIVAQKREDSVTVQSDSYSIISSDGLNWFRLDDDTWYPGNKFIIDDNKIIYPDHFIDLHNLEKVDMQVQPLSNRIN